MTNLELKDQHPYLYELHLLDFDQLIDLYNKNLLKWKYNEKMPFTIIQDLNIKELRYCINGTAHIRALYSYHALFSKILKILNKEMFKRIGAVKTYNGTVKLKRHETQNA